MQEKINTIFKEAFYILLGGVNMKNFIIKKNYYNELICVAELEKEEIFKLILKKDGLLIKNM